MNQGIAKQEVEWEKNAKLSKPPENEFYLKDRNVMANPTVQEFSSF